MNEAAKQGWNVFFWALDQRFPVWLKDVLYVAIFVSQFLCGLATVTSASRMIFAFARDGGLPGSSFLRKVSPRYRTPNAAIWAAAILCGAVRLGRFAASPSAGRPAYSIVVSCTVIFLFFSFAIPITLGLLAYGKTWTKMGPWNLGGPLFRIVAVASIMSAVLIFFIGIQPPNDWALWITVGFLVLDGDRLDRLRAAPLPGAADRRHDRQAPGGDRRRREGARRSLRRYDARAVRRAC